MFFPFLFYKFRNVSAESGMDRENKTVQRKRSDSKRLSEIKVLNRKDVNVFCDWIVTAPQELLENEYADGV